MEPQNLLDKEDLTNPVFISVILLGAVLSFLVFINSESLFRFLTGFGLGVIASISAAYALITETWRRILLFGLVSAATVSLVILSFYGGGNSCLAWSPHTAENPVTGKCEAFIYGGCGPKPDPWHYRSVPLNH